MPEGRAVAPGTTSPVRLEALKEIQQLLENRDARDRLEKSPLAEAKGREHWVLHVLLRAQEVSTAHEDSLIGSVYANLVARLQAMEDRLGRLEQQGQSLEGSVVGRLEGLDQVVGERIETSFAQATERARGTLAQAVIENLDRKWTPVGESIETFAVHSKQLVKGVDDTFRLAAQTRLLLNESVRRLGDLSKDILALEDSLKLVVSKTLEQGFGSLEARIAAIEAQLGVNTHEPAPDREPAKKPEPSVPTGT